MHVVGGGLVAGKFHQVAVGKEGAEQVAVPGDGAAGDEHGVEKLLGGLLRGAQAEAPFDVVPQDAGHPHVELLDALQGDEVVALQPVQGGQRQQVRGVRRLTAKQAPTARPLPPQDRQHKQHQRRGDDDPRPHRQAAPSQLHRRRDVFGLFEVGPLRQDGGDDDAVRLRGQLQRLHALGVVLTGERDRQRRNVELAGLTDFQEVFLAPLANLRVRHFGFGREVIVHLEGAEAVEDLWKNDVHVERRDDRQGQPQLIRHSHAAPVAGQGDDDVALDDVLLKRFLDRGARFLSGRRRRQQDSQAHQEHQADDPSTAINLKRSAMVTHYAICSPLGVSRANHQGPEATPVGRGDRPVAPTRHAGGSRSPVAFPGPIQGRWIPGQARNDDWGAIAQAIPCINMPGDQNETLGRSTPAQGTGR